MLFLIAGWKFMGGATIVDDSDAIFISYTVTSVSSPFADGASSGIVAQMKMITFFLFKLHDPNRIAVIGDAHMDTSDVPGDDTSQTSRRGTCSMGVLRSAKQLNQNSVHARCVMDTGACFLLGFNVHTAT